MLITVFTPTYNRAKLLKRLYDSLCVQTFADFEWLIIDDGSVDNTEKIVNGFIAENKIGIRYIKQRNGGKHRAINHGVREAKGELFFIVDSDDWLPEDSLETINKYYQGIKDDKSFAGISGLDGFADGKNIGDSLPKEIIDCSSIELRFKYKISGDMSEVFRTDVMKEFPFPEYEKERFCPEALVWNRIASKYKLRYFNKIIYYAEYQPDGITNAIVKARMNSPMASMMCYSELNSYDIPVIQKIKAAINYWRFRFCSNIKDKPKISFVWCWTMPLGFIMHLNDKRNYC
jgi:glycosyltransferase involved in cell wall biosynthesis